MQSEDYRETCYSTRIRVVNALFRSADASADKKLSPAHQSGCAAKKQDFSLCANSLDSARSVHADGRFHSSVVRWLLIAAAARTLSLKIASLSTPRLPKKRAFT